MPIKKDYDAVVRCTIDASLRHTWIALTSPTFIQQYMNGAEVHTTWGFCSPITWDRIWKDVHYQDKGIVLEFTPNKRLRYTHWSPRSGTTDDPDNYHKVCFDLSSKENATELTMTQSNSRGQLATNKIAKEGWQTMLNSLKGLLEN